MSLAEIEKAVDALSQEDLTKLAAYIARHDNLAWDEQIDADFSEDGRLRPLLEEVRGDLRAGRLEAVTGRTHRRFWKHFETLPPWIQIELGRQNPWKEIGENLCQSVVKSFPFLLNAPFKPRTNRKFDQHYHPQVLALIHLTTPLNSAHCFVETSE